MQSKLYTGFFDRTRKRRRIECSFVIALRSRARFRDKVIAFFQLAGEREREYCSEESLRAPPPFRPGFLTRACCSGGGVDAPR